MEKIPCTPKIGADVEQFIVNRETGLIEPCVGIIPGTKDQPYEVGFGNGYALQEDNVMAEWNIPPQEEEDHFSCAVADAQDFANEYLLEHGYKLDYENSTHTFTDEQLSSPQAQLIGCDVDYDAYLGGEPRNNPPALDNSRSTGGHIHLGGNFQCPDFVAALFAELYIGCYGGFRPYYTTPRMRWYGKPGVYRPKPYGIEYRTPDNSWVFDEDAVSSMAYAALSCTKFLTNTEATELQYIFRQFPWVRLRGWMTADVKLSKERMNLIKAAQGLGVRW